ncbi:MAG: metallophosphoesterase [Clostridia bacterium]|nr:metallophosphoesterase [Clostridia bacterium]
MSKVKKEKKKGRGKLALKIILIVLAAIVLFVGVTAVVTAVAAKAHLSEVAKIEPVHYDYQLQPYRDDDGSWYFTSSSDFKVVQLTDVHIGGGWMCISKDSSAINAVASMLQAEKPDLVIVTGDIAYPVPFQAGTFNNKTGARIFAELMERLGVYWTVCFGNHDTEAYSYFTREDIAAFYKQSRYSHCLFQDGPEDVDGVGNQVIKLKNHLGEITRAFIMLDSHSYLDDDKLGVLWHYDNIHHNQVLWYESVVNSLNSYNADLAEYAGLEPKEVKTSVFFHIPLTEYRDAWHEFEENGFNDTENVKYVRGVVGESGKQIYCGVGDDDMFEAMLALGSTDSTFCGHDHYNYFCVNYKGIDLSYGYSVDFLAYPGIWKKGSQRGCTVINCHPDGSMESELSNLYGGKYDYKGPTEDIAMQFEDVSFAVPHED